MWRVQDTVAFKDCPVCTMQASSYQTTWQKCLPARNGDECPDGVCTPGTKLPAGYGLYPVSLPRKHATASSGKRWRSPEDLWGTPNSSEDQPSFTSQEIRGQDARCTTEHVYSSANVVTCSNPDCGKLRVVYSSGRVHDDNWLRQAMALAGGEDGHYTCGDKIEDCMHEEDVLILREDSIDLTTRQGVTCGHCMEPQYYARRLHYFDQTRCYRCAKPGASRDAALIEVCTTVYPQCACCTARGLAPHTSGNKATDAVTVAKESRAKKKRDTRQRGIVDMMSTSNRGSGAPEPQGPLLAPRMVHSVTESRAATLAGTVKVPVGGAHRLLPGTTAPTQLVWEDSGQGAPEYPRHLKGKLTANYKTGTSYWRRVNESCRDRYYVHDWVGKNAPQWKQFSRKQKQGNWRGKIACTQQCYARTVDSASDSLRAAVSGGTALPDDTVSWTPSPSKEQNGVRVAHLQALIQQYENTKQDAVAAERYGEAATCKTKLGELNAKLTSAKEDAARGQHAVATPALRASGSQVGPPEPGTTCVWCHAVFADYASSSPRIHTPVHLHCGRGMSYDMGCESRACASCFCNEQEKLCPTCCALDVPARQKRHEEAAAVTKERVTRVAHEAAPGPMVAARNKKKRETEEENVAEQAKNHCVRAAPAQQECVATTSVEGTSVEAAVEEGVDVGVHDRQKEILEEGEATSVEGATGATREQDDPLPGHDAPTEAREVGEGTSVECTCVEARVEVGGDDLQKESQEKVKATSVEVSRGATRDKGDVLRGHEEAHEEGKAASVEGSSVEAGIEVVAEDQQEETQEEHEATTVDGATCVTRDEDVLPGHDEPTDAHDEEEVTSVEGSSVNGAGAGVRDEGDELRHAPTNAHEDVTAVVVDAEVEGRCDTRVEGDDKDETTIVHDGAGDTPAGVHGDRAVVHVAGDAPVKGMQKEEDAAPTMAMRPVDTRKRANVSEVLMKRQRRRTNPHDRHYGTFIGGGSLVSARRPVGTASVGEVLEMNFDNKWWRGTVTHVNALTHEVTLYFESDGESVTCKSMDPDLRRCT